ncbi:UbiA prenyltransferase family [Armillaria luteobubalina]|uniref:UbiA prenyltransferase family n=1 Tax=Armillaria luteobubalina TaxID=153913 RepID=A0AA39UPG4_9AGAR|nr:UbiA prenyltransferase family [Armillaria luteobubalina]
MRQPIERLKVQAWTLFLFTYTDYKTIFFPITFFACAAAPVQHVILLLYSMVWIWLHQLHIDVSNQYRSVAEDSVNRPWRPLPSNRLTDQQARRLRYALPPLCLLFSIAGGQDVVLASTALSIAFVLYDDFGLAGHWIGKNIMNCIGYLGFEYGATKIMAGSMMLRPEARRSLLMSSLIILTTVHAQDFSDVEGDQAMGRITLPLYAPLFSRFLVCIGVPMWSIILSLMWDISPGKRILLICFGIFVAWRFYNYKNASREATSYVFYNIWLIAVHALPACNQQEVSQSDLNVRLLPRESRY